MSKSIVVISFDEPETFKSILDTVKNSFISFDKVHIFAAVNESAEQILSIVEENPKGQ